jgi:hypothetical protein
MAITARRHAQRRVRRRVSSVASRKRSASARRECTCVGGAHTQLHREHAPTIGVVVMYCAVRSTPLVRSALANTLTLATGTLLLYRGVSSSGCMKNTS